MEKTYKPEDTRTLKAIYYLGRLYDKHDSDQDNHSRLDTDALTTLSRVEQGQKEHPELGIYHKDTILTTIRLGNFYKRHGKNVEAYLRYLEVDQNREGYKNDKTLRTMHSLAKHYYLGKDLENSERYYLDCLAKRRETIGIQHLDSLVGLVELAVVQDNMNKFRLSERNFLEAMKEYRKLFGLGHELTLDTLSKLSQLYVHKKLYDRAVPLFIDFVNGIRKLLGTTHEKSRKALEDLADIYLEMNEFTQADVVYREYLKMMKNQQYKPIQESLQILDKMTRLGQMQHSDFYRSKMMYVDVLTYLEGEVGKTDPTYIEFHTEFNERYPEEDEKSGTTE